MKKKTQKSTHREILSAFQGERPCMPRLKFKTLWECYLALSIQQEAATDLHNTVDKQVPLKPQVETCHGVDGLEHSQLGRVFLMVKSWVPVYFFLLTREPAHLVVPSHFMVNLDKRKIHWVVTTLISSRLEKAFKIIKMYSVKSGTTSLE